MIQIWTSDFEPVFRETMTLLWQLKSARQKWTAILCTTTFDIWETAIRMPSSTHGNDRPHKCLLANLKLI